MKLVLRISLLLLFLGGSGSLLALQQNQYRQFGYGEDYDSASNERAEFGWSRLRYNSAYEGYGGGFGGFRYGTWSQDYPKADRQFLIALRRLTRINAKPVEQIVDLDSDDIFNWPFVYAVQVKTWSFSDAQT
jgi:hypothetical protein